MSERSKPLILLTNDDGYRSPGLLAAAEALAPLGELLVIAPREQQTSTGRGMPAGSDCVIDEQALAFRDGTSCPVYAYGGSPAQAVRYGVLELLPGKPDLLVSGINYGENVGTCVTIFGTVGAAMEGAALGIPSLAVSLQTGEEHNYSHSPDVDFTAAARFTGLFAGMLLGDHGMGQREEFRDVDILKVEVPSDAVPDTPWRMTRLSRHYYYQPVKPRRTRPGDPALIQYRIRFEPGDAEEGTDLHALRVLRQVAVTPLSIDLTSRVDLSRLEHALRHAPRPCSR